MDKQQLRELIAEARLDEALQALKKSLQSSGNDRLLGDVIQLQSQLSELERNERMNLIGYQEANITKAKLTNTTLSLIKDLDKDGPAPVPTQHPDKPVTAPPTYFKGTGDGKAIKGTGDGGSKPHGSTSWIIGLSLLVGMVLLLVFVPCPTVAQFFAFRLALALAAGGLATLLPGMFGLDLKNGIKAAGALGIMVLVYLVNPGTLAGGGKCGSFDFTVRLVKPNDLPNYPSLKSGKLKIWIDERYDKPELNTDLVTEVKAVPSEHEGKMVDAYLEGATYWKLAVDSVRLARHETQTLHVVPDGSLDTLWVKVKNQDDTQPIASATVEVEGMPSMTTDGQGMAVMHVPLNQQRESWQVSVSAKDYKPKPAIRHSPAAGMLEIRLAANIQSKAKKK